MTRRKGREGKGREVGRKVFPASGRCAALFLKCFPQQVCKSTLSANNSPNPALKC